MSYQSGEESDFHVDYTDRLSPEYAMHAHNKDELVIVFDGESVITTECYSIKLKAPFVCFSRAGIMHSQFNNRKLGYRRYCINFYSDYAKSVFPKYSMPDSFFAFGISETQLWRIEVCLMQLIDDPSAAHELVLSRRALLFALLLTELEVLIKKHFPTADDTRKRLATDICVYIGEHCAEHLTLDTIAKQFNISRSKLVRIFRDQLEMSVGDCITATRISKSKQLLIGGMSVADTADCLGFSSTEYFINVFRRKVGITPAKFARLEIVEHKRQPEFDPHWL